MILPDYSVVDTMDFMDLELVGPLLVIMHHADGDALNPVFPDHGSFFFCFVIEEARILKILLWCFLYQYLAKHFSQPLAAFSRVKKKKK